MKCNNCNETLHANSKFCHLCGHPQVVTCKECGVDLPLNARFCSNCGKSINDQDSSNKSFGGDALLSNSENFNENLDYGLDDNDWIDIPAGEFIMGSPESDKLFHGSDEKPHLVTVGAFQLFKTPVTFSMFDNYCEAVGIEKPSDEGWGRGEFPVINVSFWDAVDFCEWLGKVSGSDIRLPTEAEWEYACRAGTTTRYSYGNEHDKSLMHIDFDEYLEEFKTKPVKQYPPNPWGLHDMHGNVSEWSASIYDSDYSGMELKCSMNDRDNNDLRVLRGGSGSMYGLSARRSFNFAVGVVNDQGFRIARSVTR